MRDDGRPIEFLFSTDKDIGCVPLASQSSHPARRPVSNDYLFTLNSLTQLGKKIMRASSLLQRITKLRRRDSDQSLAARFERLTLELGDAVLGHHRVHIGSQCRDRCAL